MEPFLADREESYLFCRRCGLVRVSSLPTEEALESYYADSYEVDRENYVRGVKRNGQELLELITRQTPVGRLLEIGCSWGGFLGLGRSRGWKVAGVELSPEPARWAREHDDLEVHCGTLASSPFAGCGQYDVVVAWHVIEHLIDPLEFLRQAHSCLRPGGILALRTPNVASFVSRLNGRAWEWFGAPTHLTLFSPRSLVRLAARAGFRSEAIHTHRGDAHNPWVEVVRGTVVRAGAGTRIKKLLGWRDSNSSLYTRGDTPVKENRRMQMLARLDRAADLSLFFLYPAELLLNLFGSGAEILFLGRRAGASGGIQGEVEQSNGH